MPSKQACCKHVILVPFSSILFLSIRFVSPQPQPFLFVQCLCVSPESHQKSGDHFSTDIMFLGWVDPLSLFHCFQWGRKNELQRVSIIAHLAKQTVLQLWDFTAENLENTSVTMWLKFGVPKGSHIKGSIHLDSGLRTRKPWRPAFSS